MSAHQAPKHCQGPYESCAAAPVLLGQQARHNPLVVCVSCGWRTSMARYGVDEGPGRLGGHLCPRCDPWHKSLGPPPVRLR